LPLAKTLCPGPIFLLIVRGLGRLSEGGITLKHLAALGIKYIMTFFVLLAFMSLGGSAPLGTRAGLALFLVVVNYLIGDLIILPVYGNRIAVVLDGVLSAIMLYGLQFISQAVLSVSGAIIMGILIGLTEQFFHRFVKEAIL
jgi:hypothetical protein